VALGVVVVGPFFPIFWDFFVLWEFKKKNKFWEGTLTCLSLYYSYLKNSKKNGNLATSYKTKIKNVKITKINFIL
jgi:hypothetical protein